MTTKNFYLRGVTKFSYLWGTACTPSARSSCFENSPLRYIALPDRNNNRTVQSMLVSGCKLYNSFAWDAFLLFVIVLKQEIFKAKKCKGSEGNGIFHVLTLGIMFCLTINRK